MEVTPVPDHLYNAGLVTHSTRRHVHLVKSAIDPQHPFLTQQDL
jgi:hypothetical protein